MKLTDATLFISLASGALYFSGYIFNLHYLDYFSAHAELFQNDVSTTILTGWSTIYARGIWFFCFFGFYALYEFFISPRVRTNEEVESIKNSISLKICFILSVSFILFLNASDLGREYAKEQYKLGSTTDFQFKNEKINGNYRVVAFTKENYLLLAPDDNLLIVPQSEIKSIKLHSFHHDGG
ncbi:hypothetical protein [Paraglaciecola sp.]|uniref:hypothetical protein n=1 Tax=Paraglaciecola sp. TaxID=1920173 RepID=UPI0030F40887